jgi:phage terminase large subunit-like protein
MAARSDRLPPGVTPPEWAPEKDTLDHYERFAWTLRVPDTGDRLRLREWQLPPLEDYFAKRAVAAPGAAPALPLVCTSAELEAFLEAGGVVDPLFFQHLWEWPTGQGKSAIFGSLVLHHGTFVVPRPRVFVIGGELEHARNTTNAAAGFVYESRNRNGRLGMLWQPQEIYGGRLVPMWLDDQDVGIFARSAGRTVEAKGGSSVEGKEPTAIFVEELHRHADGGAAVNTLITKTLKAAAHGRTVRIAINTTAGTNRDSKLGRLEAQLLDEKNGATVERDRRPGEHYIRAIDAEAETVGHIWALPEKFTPPKDGDENALTRFLEQVKRANPAEWITVQGLRRIWRSMSRFERWQFLRQHANQWVTAGFAALDRGQWSNLKIAGLTIPAGKGVRVFVGLDRASKWDTTAIVPVWRPPNGEKVRVAGAVILPSPRDGTRRRTRDVGRILETMRERWPDMVIVFDRNAGGGDVAEELEEEHGLTVIDHDQGKAFDLASMRLGEYVEEQKLEHDGNADLTEQVLAAVLKPTGGGKRWRGEAPNDDTPADGFDALAMALHMATTLPEDQDDFDISRYRITRL